MGPSGGQEEGRISPEGCLKSGNPSATYPIGDWATAPASEVKRVPWGPQKQMGICASKFWFVLGEKTENRSMFAKTNELRVVMKG